MEGTRAMPQFDAIVVGTGQAGPSLARRLVAAGRKVAVIERKHFGGTCVNTGCTPTKALIASAYAAHVARRHADYGVTDRRADRGRHEGREGAQGCDRRALAQRRGALAQIARRLHGLSGPRPVRVAERSAGRRDGAERAADLHQCRRARQRAADARPRSGGVSHQFHHGGPRRAARASDRGGRQLYRARIRAGLSALRQRRSP